MTFDSLLKTLVLNTRTEIANLAAPITEPILSGLPKDTWDLSHITTAMRINAKTFSPPTHTPQSINIEKLSTPLRVLQQKSDTQGCEWGRIIFMHDDKDGIFLGNGSRGTVTRVEYDLSSPRVEA